MTRTKKIIYWVSTLWLALGMTSTAIVQLIRMDEEVEVVTRLGYPEYLLAILGVLKLLGVIAILVPKFPLIKEWAYAGFFFAMSGAVFSHLASGAPFTDILPASLLLVLTGVSWYTRPPSRTIVQEARVARQTIEQV